MRSRDPSRRDAARRALRVLPGAALAGGALSTLTSLFVLVPTAGIFRLRELSGIRLMQRTAEHLDVDLLAALPPVFSWPLPLDTALDVWRLLGLALVTGIAAGLVRAVLASPAILGLALAWPKAFSPEHRLGAMGPSLVFAILCAPAIDGPFRAATGGLTTGPSVLWAFTISFAISLAVILALRRLRIHPHVLSRARRAAITVGASVGLASLVAFAVTSQSPRALRPPFRAGAPNVLLVSIDTLRADHVHAYGYPRATTPTIDRLAAEGVRFDVALAPAPWTLPSHMSLLTGLAPLRHGVLDDGMRLSADAVTLAEALRGAGYVTAGFVSAPYLEADYGFAQGFDSYDDYSVSPASEHLSHRAVTSPRLLAAVTRWIDQWELQAERRPFFLFVHMWDPHYDFIPPPPFDRRFDPDYTGSVSGDDFERGSAVHAGMDPRDLAHVIALYDGEIAWTDQHLGRILDRLRAAGELDRTLVVVTGDHGEEFFEHGVKGHRQNLYDTALRVPLVMRLPDVVPSGVVVARQVRLLDVASTILGIIGLTPPAGFAAAANEGEPPARDLQPLFDRVADPAAGAAWPELVAVGDLHGEVGSLRTEREKIILGSYKGTPIAKRFDLASDPGELHDLIGQDPASEAPLREALAHARRALTGSPVLSVGVQVDEDHLERLRALGYIE